MHMTDAGKHTRMHTNSYQFTVTVEGDNVTTPTVGTRSQAQEKWQYVPAAAQVTGPGSPQYMQGVRAQSTNRRRGGFLLPGTWGAGSDAEEGLGPPRPRSQDRVLAVQGGCCLGTGRTRDGTGLVGTWGRARALGHLCQLRAALLPTAASNSALRLLRTYLPSHSPAASQRPSRPQGSSVIYSQVKVASLPASAAPRS